MAKTSPPSEPQTRIVDNPAAPEVFADGVVGAFLLNGSVHITLASRRCDYSKQPNVFTDAVIGRVVMSFGATESAVRFLSDFLERMRKLAATEQPTSAPRTLQ